MFALASGAAAFGIPEPFSVTQAIGAAALSDPPLPPRRPDDLQSPGGQGGTTTRERAQESSACFALLKLDGADFTPVQTHSDGGDCDVDGAVRLSGLTLENGQSVSFENRVILRCDFAAQLVRWIRGDLAPILQKDGLQLRRLIGVGGQECRFRNRQNGERISEHARGNAFDVHQLGVQDGDPIGLMKGGNGAGRLLRERIRASACARFTTVLGSGSDGFHEDHLHVDQRERRGGFRLCQWDVQ